MALSVRLRVKRMNVSVRRKDKDDVEETEDELIFKWFRLLGISSISFESPSEGQFIQKTEDNFGFSCATFIRVSSNSQKYFPLKKYVLPEKGNKNLKMEYFFLF